VDEAVRRTHHEKPPATPSNFQPQRLRRVKTTLYKNKSNQEAHFKTVKKKNI
jgi:hypothetical protein